MPELSLAIPVLPVTDTAKSAKFYVEALGFTCLFDNGSYAALARDRIHIHLWHARDEGWKTGGGAQAPASPVVSGAESFLAGTASCRMECEELEALYAACNAKGIVHPNGHLRDRDFGQRDFGVLDPDGNLITFFKVIGMS